MSALTIIVVVLVYVGGGNLYSRRLIHALIERARLPAQQRNYFCVVWHSTIIYILIWPLRAVAMTLYRAFILIAEFILRNIFTFTDYLNFRGSQPR
jgi:hypothetical protein